jgi:hypothetical protein
VYLQDKPVLLPGQKKEWKPSDPKDFVRFVMGRLSTLLNIDLIFHLVSIGKYIETFLLTGSSAGAGSGEFHVYRSTRRRENNRLKYIDDKAKKVITGTTSAISRIQTCSPVF